ncbi:MAG: hypothetical protein J5722_09125 [Oscillospiraceae bacterium]|nr:hypothetical protein [Oscillospiraceae bacterium]
MQGQSRKAFLILLISLLVLLLILSGRTWGAFDKGLPLDMKAQRYPYQQLSMREKKLYTALYNGIEAHQETIKLPGMFKEEEYKRVYLLVAEQEPQFFYLDTVFETAEIMSEANISYSLDAETAHEMTIEMDLAADNILKKASGEDIEKLLAIHDGIAKYCEYADGEYSSEAYGCLVQGKAKCEGYSKAFLYVARRAGLNVMNVTGTDSRGENHVWNIAEADGNYCQIDLTWDDDQRYEGKTVHACFALPDSSFTDHTPDLSAYTPPVCEETESLRMDYYKWNNHYLESASELPAQIMAWPGATGMMEFRLSSSDELASAKKMMSKSSSVREAVQNASGAAAYRAMADEIRNVLVILPS